MKNQTKQTQKSADALQPSSTNPKQKPVVKVNTITPIQKSLWDNAREWYHYPAVSDPIVLGEGMDGGAYFDFITNGTVISNEFVEKLSKEGKLLNPNESFVGVANHEIGHYMVFPRTLSTTILLGKFIGDFFSDSRKEEQGFILQTYADMANDVASVLEEQRRDSILKIRESIQKMLDGVNRDVREVMIAYLYFQAGQNYTASKSNEKYIEKMKEIDFLNENIEAMRQGVFKFGTIIKEMLKNHQSNGQGKGQGSSDGEGGELSSDFDDMDVKEIFKNATPKDIKKALGDISKKVTKGEFDRVKKWLKEQGAPVDENKRTIQIGTSEGNLPVDMEVVDYYKILSTQYPIVVGKKLIKTKSFKKSWDQIEKWKVGTEPLLALPNSSGGMFLPGITKKIKIHPHPIRSTDYKIPSVLVIIDSSGSMPDPKGTKSYAVLAAYCAVRSYHLNEAFIGVINFSGSSFYLPYTRDLDAALGALSAYQGGGTTIDIEMIEKMLGKDKAEFFKDNPGRNIHDLPREVVKKELQIALPDDIFSESSLDLILFTDGGISNLQETIDLFTERKELNRATIVLNNRFEQIVKVEDKGKIQVYHVENDKDIPNIVIKEVQKNMDTFIESDI